MKMEQNQIYKYYNQPHHIHNVMLTRFYTGAMWGINLNNDNLVCILKSIFWCSWCKFNSSQILCSDSQIWLNDVCIYFRAGQVSSQPVPSWWCMWRSCWWAWLCLSVLTKLQRIWLWRWLLPSLYCLFKFVSLHFYKYMCWCLCLSVCVIPWQFISNLSIQSMCFCLSVWPVPIPAFQLKCFYLWHVSQPALMSVCLSVCQLVCLSACLPLF